MIQAVDLSKNIGIKEVLKNISFEVPIGSVFGIFGPSGAGKSTLIKILAGIWKQDSGRLYFDGEISFDNPKFKDSLGFVPETCHYFSNYKITDLMDLYRLSFSKYNEKRFNALMDFFELNKRNKVGELSKGMKTKLMISFNLSIMPKFLLLDEPTSGIDFPTRKNILQILLDQVYTSNMSIIIASHNLMEIEQLCEYIALLDNGELKFCGLKDEIKQKFAKVQVISDDINLRIENDRDFIKVTKIGDGFEIITKDFSDHFIVKIREKGFNVLEVYRLTLEDIIQNFYGKQIPQMDDFEETKNDMRR